MIPWRALPLILLAGAALAADAPEPEDEETPTFASAAVGGAFDALPPSGNGYPLEVLARIRIELGGEDPNAAPAKEPEAPSDGH